MADSESGYREATEKSLAHERAERGQAELARYAERWRALSLWGWRAVGSFGVGVVAFVLGWANRGGADLDVVSIIVAACAWLHGYYCCFRWAYAPCPRCGGSYVGGWFRVGWPWTPSRCTQCRLPYRATHDTDRAAD